MKKKNQKGFVQIILILVIVFVAIGGVYYFGTLKNKTSLSQTTPKPVVTVQPDLYPTVKPSIDPIANWKTYTSSVFNYSFKYPVTWSTSLFKENDPDILFGSNSLQNYSTTEVEKYMDHGLVDWVAYLNDKPAIKIDFAVYSKSSGPNQYQNKNEFLNKLINESAKKLEVSDLKIGSLPTEQYKAKDNLGPTDVPEINTFVAYPDDNHIIYMHLSFWNIKSYDLLKKTPEWLDFSQILSTFKFTNQ